MLMQEVLNDIIENVYNLFVVGVNFNIECVFIDVYCKSEFEFKIFDVKFFNLGIFELLGGLVGFVLGLEYCYEFFKDDCDFCFDGIIQFIDVQGDIYFFVLDVVNFSLILDNLGSCLVMLLFVEF